MILAQEEGRFGAGEEFWDVTVGIILGMSELPGLARRKEPDGTESGGYGALKVEFPQLQIQPGPSPRDVARPQQTTPSRKGTYV